MGRRRSFPVARRAVAAALLTSVLSAAVPMAGSAGVPGGSKGAPGSPNRAPARQEPDSAKITPAVIDAGRAIFHGKGTCFACHGMNLEGTQVAPTLKHHAWRDAKNGELANIFYVATHGVPGTLMVAFPGGITRAEAVQVASYVWSVGQGKAKP